MRSFKVYNIRMMHVKTIQAETEKDALVKAKEIVPGAVVEKVLTRQEERQQEYYDYDSRWVESGRLL